MVALIGSSVVFWSSPPFLTRSTSGTPITPGKLSQMPVLILAFAYLVLLKEADVPVKAGNLLHVKIREINTIPKSNVLIDALIYYYHLYYFLIPHNTNMPVIFVRTSVLKF